VTAERIADGAPGAEVTPVSGDRSGVEAAIAEQLGSRREARWIVDHAGTERAQGLADRRMAGEPLQYVLGRWPFRTLDLQVDRRVLIPRPETEHVVGVALAALDHDSRVAVDLGTGSGAIALSLAAEGARRAPGIEIWATDASSDALEVARQNLAILGRTDPGAAGRVRTVLGSWFDALPADRRGRVDLVVSNPPYVGESEYPDLDPTVRLWEPRGALVAGRGSGGVEGMAAIEAVVSGAAGWLAPRGVMVVEIAPTLAAPSVDAARSAGFAGVAVQPDLAGRLRVLVARR
jgi:release factor glutamine methyltransferase